MYESSSVKALSIGFFQRLLAWIGEHELATLLLIAVVGGGGWAFAELADEVSEGETQRIDRQVLLALRTTDDVSDPLGPDWLEEVGRDVTALGSGVLLVALTLGVAGFLWLRGDHTTAIFLVAAVGGGILLSGALKYVFDRPRPDLVPHGSRVYTKSFPSGHSMISAVTYLTLGALLARVQTSRRIRAYLLIVAILLTVSVGVSRVYLGVHWPTDVLAGWSVGAAWAAACWLAHGRFVRGRLDLPVGQ